MSRTICNVLAHQFFFVPQLLIIEAKIILALFNPYLLKIKFGTATYLEWKMWLQGNFLAPVTISSRQMIQTLSEACRSSGVASGYLKAQQKRRESRPSTSRSINAFNKKGKLKTKSFSLWSGNNPYNVFMLRMALRDMIASVTAFLNCLRKKRQTSTIKTWPNTFQKEMY